MTNVEDINESGPSPTATSLSSGESETTIAFLLTLAEQLVTLFPSNSEVVIHDLQRLPATIVGVFGDVTSREIGDPPTDVLLQQLRQESSPDVLSGYETRLPDGRQVRSTTLIVRDSKGARLAALCLNVDMTAWYSVRSLVDSLFGAGRPTTGLVSVPATVPSARADLSAAAPVEVPVEPTPEAVSPITKAGEHFAQDVDSLATQLLDGAIADVGIPVELMKKEHKMQVVAALEGRGLFLLRDSVETVATYLECSRFTIYNYLRELQSNEHGKTTDRSVTPRG
ncbi:helix-turn-helix transcriptional regulator [Rhodococcus sovatensis]|uniref:PAS domain-containing protein n=1 Tax=Rhodococcus sovatensis TaxID=1805840 RepID=A0ABZ2PIS9_9NOCA